MLQRCCVLFFTASVVATTGYAQRQPGTFTFTNTNTQTLADGTHITSTTHRTMMRDGYGRTRNENEFERPGQKSIRMVNIYDPVAGFYYNFQVGSDPHLPHTYNKMDIHPIPQNAGLRTLPAPTATPPALSDSKPSEVASGTVSVVTGVVTGWLGSVAPTDLKPAITREQLGFDNVQGVSCRSMRTTEVYPVGFFGNDRPITVVQESCISQEYGMSIRDVRTDPRTGTHTMTLDSASFTEPPATAFQPPPDYTEFVRPGQQ